MDSLLPIENPHPDFLVFVVVAGWCKIVHVCLLIYGQCNIYIFFIDFEKEDHSVSKEADALPNVSVWRNILIANEWCEMQTERHTDVDFTLMFLLFFLKGLKYINLATPQPEENDLSDDDPNIVLRFFVICFFYFLVVLGQVIYKALMYRFDSDPLDTFADLCNLSNISVFILDELDLLHGFYIHGRSVHPQTDVNMKTMLTNFNDEQVCLCPCLCLCVCQHDDRAHQRERRAGEQDAAARAEQGGARAGGTQQYCLRDVHSRENPRRVARRVRENGCVQRVQEQRGHYKAR